jgi:hypothetical protein
VLDIVIRGGVNYGLAHSTTHRKHRKMKIQNFIRICLITSSLVFVATTEAARELNFACSDNQSTEGLAFEFLGTFQDGCTYVAQYNVYRCTGSSGTYVNTVRIKANVAGCVMA